MLAYRALRVLQPAEDDPASKRNVAEAMRLTADRLGNTPSVARGSYVHPAVLEAYLDGSLGGALVEAAEDLAHPPAGADPSEERAVMTLLRQRQRGHGRRRGSATRGRPGRAPG